MKTVIFSFLILTICEAVNSQNVGIGINTPLAPLHIKKDLEALRVEGSAPYLAFYNNSGIVPKAFMQNSGNNLYLGTSTGNTTGITQFYANQQPVITLLPSGNVGIGTAVPDEKLTVQTLNNSYGIFHRGEGGNILGTRMGGTSAGIGTFSNTNMRIFANGSTAMFINSGNSYVGVGVDFPANKLQIGSIGSTGYAGNDFVVGNGTNAVRMYQTSTVSLIASSADILFWPKEKAGNVGVNCVFPPTNKLQIGDVGGAGFAGNDLAIGNGTNAVAIYQSNTSTLIGSTTDIVLKPRNNGHGRVGINTNTPRAPLDVIDFADVPDEGGANYVNYAYLALRYVNFQPSESVGGTIQSVYPKVSIFASGRIVATEFDANSDARIKDITGFSNTARDLETVNGLNITDYTMKDKVKFGNRQFKKVVAQEVEKVYPQVISRHTDFIPNVYQTAIKLQKVINGYLLTFSDNHSISSHAKKLRVLMLSSTEGLQEVDIVSIPSDKEVIIKTEDIKSDKVFVYGEEVDDFRTVDYEGLTTLNISATQELSRLEKKQQAIISNQQKQINTLEKRLTALEIKLSGNLVGIK